MVVGDVDAERGGVAFPGRAWKRGSLEGPRNRKRFIRNRGGLVVGAD